ncbi:MAG: radical SAM/SPASM domain-containing protein [Candidatus Orphnella occulta]|nr:radical SAM/SPASM domain-containing protein [Candidatus Orphnella occulta]
MSRAVFFYIERVLYIKRFMLGAVLFLRYTTFKKCINLFCVELDRMSWRKVARGKPYFIKIQPTNKCDAGCKYCLKEKSTDPIGKMTLFDFKMVIDSVKDYAYMIALHYSGEPLLNDHIYDMISYAHAQKIATYISTNLQQLSPTSARNIISSNLDLLTVSIDGLTQETYRCHRKNGKLSNVFDNIRMLIDEKQKQRSKYPLVNLQLLVTAYNEHEVPGFKSLARSLGVDSFDLKPIGTHDKSLLPRDSKYIRGVYRKKNMKRKPCWWLWGAMVVLWDSAVIPCCMLSTHKEYSSAGEDIFFMRNSNFYQQLRVKTVCAETKDICSQCAIPYGSIFSQTT